MKYELGVLAPFYRSFSDDLPKKTHAIVNGLPFCGAKLTAKAYSGDKYEVVILTSQHDTETITDKKHLPSCSACKRKKAFKEAIARIES